MLRVDKILTPSDWGWWSRPLCITFCRTRSITFVVSFLSFRDCIAKHNTGLKNFRADLDGVTVKMYCINSCNSIFSLNRNLANSLFSEYIHNTVYNKPIV